MPPTTKLHDARACRVHDPQAQPMTRMNTSYTAGCNPSLCNLPLLSSTDSRTQAHLPQTARGHGLASNTLTAHAHTRTLAGLSLDTSQTNPRHQSDYAQTMAKPYTSRTQPRLWSDKVPRHGLFLHGHHISDEFCVHGLPNKEEGHRPHRHHSSREAHLMFRSILFLNS